MQSVRSTLSVAAAFLFSAVLLAVSPEPRAAEDAHCGANNGNLCWEDEACIWILFYKQCTTKYKYYPGDNGDDGDAADAFGSDPLAPWLVE